MSVYAQLIAHLFGDYILQSSWMANNKTKRWFPAIVHACAYSTPFLIMFRPSFLAMVVIISTHILIDHFRLAKYLAFTSQYLAPPSEWKSWFDCNGTGYHKDTPVWLAMWLMIIVDNTMHLIINYWALASL